MHALEQQEELSVQGWKLSMQETEANSFSTFNYSFSSHPTHKLDMHAWEQQEELSVQGWKLSMQVPAANYGMIKIVSINANTNFNF